MALARALKRAGWSLQEAEQLVRVISRVVGDPELEDRLRTVHDTYDKPDTEPTTGPTRLKEFIEDAAAELAQ
ncbi:MAG: hypothetical protein RMJ88_14900 [Thermogemmata sp.]|nr:hypothetical protein [Thermogemmata sp.]